MLVSITRLASSDNTKFLNHVSPQSSPDGEVTISEDVNVIVLPKKRRFFVPFIKRRVFRHILLHMLLLVVVETRLRTT